MERWRVEQVEEEQRVAESCEVEQRAVMLAMEQCWVPLEAMMPQASPSKVAMKQAEWTPRVVFPEKIYGSSFVTSGVGKNLLRCRRSFA